MADPTGPIGGELSRGRRASKRRRARGRERLDREARKYEATQQRLLTQAHESTEDPAEILAVLEAERRAFLAGLNAAARREVRDGLRLGMRRGAGMLGAAGVAVKMPRAASVRRAQARLLERIDTEVARLGERLEDLQGRALAHPTALVARRATVDRRSMMALDRNVSGGSEQAGLAAVALASGVRHFIHVGPVDSSNHPVSHIYLGMVQTLREWELVSPGAVTFGLHANERGELVPVSPDMEGLEDRAELEHAIESGDPYRRGDLFASEELDALNRPLRPDEALAVDQERKQLRATMRARAREAREVTARRARLAAARDRLARARR